MYILSEVGIDRVAHSRHACSPPSLAETSHTITPQGEALHVMFRAGAFIAALLSRPRSSHGLGVDVSGTAGGGGGGGGGGSVASAAAGGAGGGGGGDGSDGGASGGPTNGMEGVVIVEQVASFIRSKVRPRYGF